ncbi:MAG TPA: Ig-like domain-containing protein, partial [Polyangiales bacterium]
MTGSARALSPDIVVSQIYGGGGNTGATYTHDFIELYNRGAAPVVINGWSVKYASSTGTSWTRTDIDGVIQPGGYYLIQQAQGAGGTQPLPTPNAIGTILMSGSTGKVALLSNRTPLSGACPTSAAIVDFVGFGAANCAETSPTPALSNTTAALRDGGGAEETDHNLNDFSVGPPTPRSAESAPSVLSLSPANGATNVATSASVTLTFSEPVNLANDAVTLECPVGLLIESSALQTNATSVTLTPASGLPSGVTCRVAVEAASVNDVDTNDPPDGMA